MAVRALLLVAMATGALAACDPAADRNPNAPGSPGTGNARERVAPQAADGPPGGPSGVKGSAPHPGASGGDVMPGTSGRGSSEVGSGNQVTQPGGGLSGGLGGSTGMGMTGNFPAGTPTQARR